MKKVRSSLNPNVGLPQKLRTRCVPGHRAVLADSGRAGEKAGLFEHPNDYPGTITLGIATAPYRTKTEPIRKLLEIITLVRRDLCSPSASL